MTIVYYTKSEQLPDSEFKYLVSLLPIKMQQKLWCYRRWQDAYAYLYGRLLLKEGMENLGFNYSLESMKRTKYGKPYFENVPFGFNISHSGEYVVCVISMHEKEHLGVDVEKIKPINFNDYDWIFSNIEKQKLDSYHKFYKFWTRKEAIVKADGRGFQIALDKVDTTQMITSLEDINYYLYQINLDKTYMAHVASCSEINFISMVNFVPSLLSV